MPQIHRCHSHRTPQNTFMHTRTRAHSVQQTCAVKTGVSTTTMHGRGSRAGDTCACASASLTAADLPTITRRGEWPLWDRYLDKVYGRGGIEYPVELQSFVWFYRCDCRVANSACNGSATMTACAGMGESWRSSCSAATLPFANSLLPRVWMSTTLPAACASPRPLEATVGVHLASHARRNPGWRNWPNPEFKLAPFGFWLYPRPVPKCLANETWVEVIRRREAYEGDNPFAWYYHAPGSGIWLNTGRTICSAAEQRDARHFDIHASPPQVANATSLLARGFARGFSIDGRLSPRLRRSNSNWRGSIDTMQRNGPFGNMLEIVDIRPAATQHCGRAGCTCSGTLRAGWKAGRPCRCDETRELLNCAADASP